MNDEIENLQDELQWRLEAKPESGEQWADICFIEAEIIRLKAEYAEANGQFGVRA